MSSSWIFGRRAILGLLLITVVLVFRGGLAGTATALLRTLRSARRELDSHGKE